MSLHSSLEVIELGFVISLPEWIDDFLYWVPRYYSSYHQWAGQVETHIPRNAIEEQLSALEGYKDMCIHPWGSWIRFECPPGVSLARLKKERMEEIDEILRQYPNYYNGTARKGQYLMKGKDKL